MIEVNHWLQTKFMGPLTREIVDTWFKKTTFRVYDSMTLDDYFTPLGIWKKTPVIPVHLLRHTVVELHGEVKNYSLVAGD